jgi:hypothetical protein
LYRWGPPGRAHTHCLRDGLFVPGAFGHFVRLRLRLLLLSLLLLSLLLLSLLLLSLLLLSLLLLSLLLLSLLLLSLLLLSLLLLSLLLLLLFVAWSQEENTRELRPQNNRFGDRFPFSWITLSLPSSFLMREKLRLHRGHVLATIVHRTERRHLQTCPSSKIHAAKYRVTLRYFVL